MYLKVLRSQQNYFFDTIKFIRIFSYLISNYILLTMYKQITKTYIFIVKNISFNNFSKH